MTNTESKAFTWGTTLRFTKNRSPAGNLRYMSHTTPATLSNLRDVKTYATLKEAEFIEILDGEKVTVFGFENCEWHLMLRNPSDNAS